MLRDFIAIDFETANQEPSSVCSVGVVMVRDGQIVDSFYSLIQPEPNYYNYWCQRVHGISQDDTEDAPVFSKVWQQLEERIVEVYFSNQVTDDIRYQIATLPFVAHNARFDEGCLKAVFKVYQMDYPDYRFYDTLTASRRQFGQSLPNHQLQTVAVACGYDLQNHHHALADADGIVFHTGVTKDLYRQLLADPRSEVCFACDKYQVRVEGKFELVEEMALKEEIVNHPSRKFLKPWREQQGDEAFFGFLKVFRMQHGKAHVWCMEDNFKPKEYIEL